MGTASRGQAARSGNGNGGALTRKTIGGIDYNVISVNTFDPARSSGRTVMPDAEIIAAMNANMNQIAVKDGGPEKATRIARLSFDFGAQPDDRPANERNLVLTNPKAEMYYSVPALNAKAKSRRGADTLQFGPVEGLIAYGHGHIDGTSDGMIDKWDPSIGLYGDIESLRANNRVPMATVSEGRIGWHQMENGRLQFMYPVGSYSDSDEDRKEELRMIEEIQKNLDLQQSLFQRRIP